MGKELRIFVAVAAIAVALWLGLQYGAAMLRAGFSSPPVKVGILHSLTGTMAVSEKSVVHATLLAIEEVNREGGLLGRDIEPIVVDGCSDSPTFALEAARLLTQEKVGVVFGCWTSASRKTVEPIFKEHDSLLFYPVQYEGLEQSPNIIYMGAAPNQQILPAVKWCFDNLGKKFFLVGSDYVFPRTANALIQEQVDAIGGEILDEKYILLGSTEVTAAVEDIVEDIVATQPDVILNTINGSTNREFFRALRAAGITSEKIPTMSFSIAEAEVQWLGAQDLAGDYACWNYFQSVDSLENRRFVEAFRARYGSDRVTDDPMEAAYTGVLLWAQAVRDAETFEATEVRKALARQTIRAPGGIVSVDAENQHAWKTVRIGQIQSNGQFTILWSSEKPVRPVPYPIYRSRAEWQAFLEQLFDGWGESWVNPGP